MKVFGIGFHKTGTTTLDKALTTLGYRVCGVRPDLAKHLFEDNLSPIFETVENYDAFQDNPWPLLYKALDHRFPNSKFILTLRTEEKWINSIRNHFGENHTEMRRWIYGIGNPKGNETTYLQKYASHNEEVKEYFRNRSNDLLMVSWEKGDGWEEICEFLNKPIPKAPFPRANKGAYSKTEKNVRKIKKWIRHNLG